jgi:hypothetical protein
VSALDSIRPQLREALAAFETWRKMGYPPEEIFFACGKRGEIAMVLRHDGIDFAYTCGSVEVSQEEAATEWRAAGETWNKKLGSDERKTIYEGSFIRRNVVQLIALMNQKGLRVRKVS